MGPGVLRSDYVGELVPVLGKALEQVKAIAQNENCEPSTERLAAGKLQQLFARRGLIVDFHIEQIQQQNVKRTSLRTRREIYKCIRRQGSGTLREGVGGAIECVAVEAPNPLRF